ncbi:hypothetical protein BJV77DRAFT_1011536 [Russula vinacea]|nr:hypothetical protein BJV77DRAFT_1011536 [Russula vinacea]
MNRPRESLLTLFDPLFSGDPASTPPPRREAPSPDLGSDKENTAPSASASDSPITLTKFFNRIYTRRKVAAQLPRPLPRGRLVDLGDADASVDHGDDSDSDSDDGRREQHGSPLLTGKEEEEEGASLQRRPLADIALGDAGTYVPHPCASSSPLASVINAINGTTSRSPSSSPPSTPSAPRIAITPAEPTAVAPGHYALTSPDVDVDADLLDRRTSVDLQEALSVHFDEASSFDLLKDKILFPENDSLDGDLDIDMAGVPAAKVLEDGDQGDIFVMPIADANAESGSEVDCVGLLEERLRDINIMEEDGVLQNKNGDRDIGTATPPAQFSSYNVPTPQAPVRQRMSVRSSISSILPMPASSSTAPQITKKEKAKPGMTMMAPSIPARKSVGGTTAQSQLPPPRTSASNMTLGGVQRPPARAMSVSSSAASTRMQSQSRSQPQRPGAQAAPSSKVAVASASRLRRPSGLPAPMSRVGASGIAVPRASALASASSGAGTGGARRASLAVGGGSSGGGRLGSTGVKKVGPVKSVGQGASANARMMRRV